MTAATDLQLPPITCPSSLIASCPPLLGFQPERSLICLVHTKGLAQPVVARVDLVPDEHARDCAADLAARFARTGGSHVTIVLWIDVAQEARRGELPGLPLVEQLQSSLGEHRLTVDLAVATNGQSWWPLLCSDPTCCSDQARPVDAEIAGRVQLQYALAGYAPLAARGDLGRRLAADPLSCMRTRRYLAETPNGSTSLATRRREVARLWQVLRPVLAEEGSRRRPCDPTRHEARQQRGESIWPQRPAGARGRAIASPQSAIRALSDVGIRDALLVRFANDETSCRACWHHSIEVLVDVVRAAPPGHVAPGATLLALVAWLAGDGALGSVAVDRALADDSSYRLALLVSQLIGSGLAPRQWRASAMGLTEEQCLRSTRPPAQGARG